MNKKKEEVKWNNMKALEERTDKVEVFVYY